MRIAFLNFVSALTAFWGDGQAPAALEGLKALHGHIVVNGGESYAYDGAQRLRTRPAGQLLTPRARTPMPTAPAARSRRTAGSPDHRPTPSIILPLPRRISAREPQSEAPALHTNTNTNTNTNTKPWRRPPPPSPRPPPTTAPEMGTDSCCWDFTPAQLRACSWGAVRLRRRWTEARALAGWR